MKTLIETSNLLGGSTNENNITTKLIAPQEEDDVPDTTGSRIPKKYHIIKSFPIFPKEYADHGYRVYNKNNMWNVVLWPSANPDSREDVNHLSDAVRLMLDEIQGDSVTKQDFSTINDVTKAKQYAARLIQLYEKRCSVLKIAIDEIIRQVSAHCTERGTLLSFLINDLIDSFQEIPAHYNSSLKILKKEVDQLRISLDAKNMEIEGQAKDLNEQISLMQLERRMEKEWHTQLSEQIKKWQNQVDSYKKKAQEQIQLEQKVLESQIASLRDVVKDLRLENNALKEQLQFQRSEIVKAEKRYAEYDAQIQIMNKKTEKLQIQLSKGGGSILASPSTPEVETINQKEEVEESNQDNGNGNVNIVSQLVEGSKLKTLLREVPAQSKIAGQMSQKDITRTTFALYDALFNRYQTFSTNIPLDDFYAARVIITEETPQQASDTARTYLDCLSQTEEIFPLAKLTLDFFRRKYGDPILRIFISFYAFYKAQPFMGNIQLDKTTDVPSIPVPIAVNLVTAMFQSILNQTILKELCEEIKAVAVGERGKEPMISIINVFSLSLEKIVEHYKKKHSDVQNSFQRTYSRFQRSITAKIPGVDPSIPRMDWRTFRDFIKPLRAELTTSEIETIFIESLQFSDSCTSMTMDAFDTMCVSRQIYVNRIDPPGSGKRLRYVPAEIVKVIDDAWNSYLRSSVKKAITELTKSETSQSAVTTLRTIDSKLDEYIKNPLAGPFCVQLLHEAASIISREAVGIAASQPIERCLAITQKQLTILAADSVNLK